MEINNIPEWVKEHVGSTVSHNYAKDAIGVIVGYGISRWKDCVIVTHDGGGQLDLYHGPNFASDGISYGQAVGEVYQNYKSFIWIQPERILNFINKSENSKTKIISDFPHTCPKCKGPAYIGFLTTIDCKSKCSKAE